MPSNHRELSSQPWLRASYDASDPNVGCLLTGKQFDRYASFLRGALLRIATIRCGYVAAQDVTQNALVAAWQHRARFDTTTGDGGFAKFLTAYLRLSCRDFNSRVARREIPTDPEVLFRSLDADILPDLTSEYYARCRERLLDLLLTTPLSSMQETCVHQWLDGVTQACIADFLGISQATVCVHLRRVAVRLRQARREEVDLDVLEMLREMDTENSDYTKPSLLWDRDGLSESIEARRGEAAQERYEARREREGYRP